MFLICVPYIFADAPNFLKFGTPVLPSQKVNLNTWLTLDDNEFTNLQPEHTLSMLFYSVLEYQGILISHLYPRECGRALRKEIQLSRGRKLVQSCQFL